MQHPGKTNSSTTSSNLTLMHHPSECAIHLNAPSISLTVVGMGTKVYLPMTIHD
jgi:hypothetical protein